MQGKADKRDMFEGYAETASLTGATASFCLVKPKMQQSSPALYHGTDAAWHPYSAYPLPLKYLKHPSSSAA